VLVTGSSGRVGGAVARQLLASGHEVVGLDRTAGPATTVVTDLRQATDVVGALVGVDAVVHAASLHAPHVGVVSEREFRDVNVRGTRDLLDAAARAGIRRFVYTSSTSVYGGALVPDGETVWVTEALVPRPRDVYDVTKLAAEAMVTAADSGELSTVCLRIARCFPEPLETWARYRLHRGVGLGDVADAHVLAVDGEGTGVVNVAGPYPFAPTDVTRLLHGADAVIAERLPSAVTAFAHRGWRLPRTVDRVYDSSAAARVLGYRPKQGLASLLAGDGEEDLPDAGSGS
jgi:nucleoside-diphosphate-sugar epimerase